MAPVALIDRRRRSATGSLLHSDRLHRQPEGARTRDLRSANVPVMEPADVWHRDDSAVGHVLPNAMLRSISVEPVVSQFTAECLSVS